MRKLLAGLLTLVATASPALADEGVGACIWGIPDYPNPINFTYRRCYAEAEQDGGGRGCSPWDKTWVSPSGIENGRRMVKTRKIYGDWTAETLKDPSYRRATWWFQVRFDNGQDVIREYKLDAGWALDANDSCHRAEDTYQFVQKGRTLDLVRGCPAAFDNCTR